MPFALVFTLSNLGKGGNSPEPDVVDPSSGLSDGSSRPSRLTGFSSGLAEGACPLIPRKQTLIGTADMSA